MTGSNRDKGLIQTYVCAEMGGGSVSRGGKEGVVLGTIASSVAGCPVDAVGSVSGVKEERG